MIHLNSKRDESDERDLLPHESTRLCKLVNNGGCREDNAVWAAFIRTFPLYRRRRMPPKEKMFLLSSQLALARVWVWTAHQPVLAAWCCTKWKRCVVTNFSSLAVMKIWLGSLKLFPNIVCGPFSPDGHVRNIPWIWKSTDLMSPGSSYQETAAGWRSLFVLPPWKEWPSLRPSHPHSQGGSSWWIRNTENSC